MKQKSLLTAALLAAALLIQLPLSYATNGYQKKNGNENSSEVKRNYIEAFRQFSDASDQLQCKALSLVILQERVEKASQYLQTFENAGTYPGYEDDMTFAKNLYEQAKKHYTNEQKEFNKLADWQRSTQYRLQSAAKNLQVLVVRKVQK